MSARPSSPGRRDALVGCLVGAAVGDSVGLPAEGLTRRRIARRWPGPWRHRLVGSWGMCSDDTEHAFLVAQALLASGGDPERFRRALAWRLRWWLAGLPAGVGFATLKGCLKLWLGWPPRLSGVGSAGNGPAMRAPLIGAFHARDRTLRRAHVEASTLMTHRDPRALVAAAAVADTAAWLAGGAEDRRGHLEALRALGEDEEWPGLVEAVTRGLERGASVDEVARELGLEEGVTGYAYHTVPMALYAVLRHLDDPRGALEALWRCGGDTDSTGAVAGGLLGVRHGAGGFPADWVADIHNGPLSVEVLERAGAALAEGGERPVRWAWPLVPLRNLFFLKVVVLHGLRRLLP